VDDIRPGNREYQNMVRALEEELPRRLDEKTMSGFELHNSTRVLHSLRRSVLRDEPSPEVIAHLKGHGDQNLDGKRQDLEK
jgi:hypothetical protein